jgi:alpha-galactosidase
MTSIQRTFAPALAAATLLFAQASASAAPGTIISVPTAHAALTLCLEPDGRVYQLGFGSKSKQPGLPEKTPDREREFLPAYGNGYILEPAIQATHADGNTSTDFIFVTNQTTKVDDDISITKIEFKDRYYPFFVSAYLKSYSNEDVLEEWTDIRNDEDGEVTLYRFASASPRIDGKQFWLTQFHGDWSREAEMSEERLSEGVKILDSKIGVRASQYRIPSFMLSRGGPARETVGEVFGGSLKWSGSYQLAFDVDWDDRLRVLAGINPFGSQYHLGKGQIFTTPAMLWTWSDHGKGQVSRNFHNWARKYGIRDGNRPRPVLLNNWEATYFDFNEEKLVSLLDQAKDLGFELFLLDDGWFANKYPRNGDTSGLGDWQANIKKLPHGLGFLADEAVKRGLRFGIWLEPEMVNPKSELYEKHPDWVIMQPHREPLLSRHQLVLDLSNPAVEDFSWNVIDSTLGPNPNITYVKWDANRYVTQPGSSYLKPEDQSHLLIDYNFHLYDIMKKFAEKYPNVMAMLCSGGSGRADYGALKYFDSFWPSDNTDPLKRVFIQWGFSHFFPANTICAHVTRSGNRPLKFTLDVAMSDDLGFDVDLAKTKLEERQQMADAIKLYKEDLREVVGQGDLYRLESPYDGIRSCLDYVSADKSKAVLFVYQLKSASAKPVRVQGLDPQRQYTILEVNLVGGAQSQMPSNGQAIDGKKIMHDGLVPPCNAEFDSAIVELEAK